MVVPEDGTHLLRPTPRRPQGPYSLTPTSTSSSSNPPTPSDSTRPDYIDVPQPDSFLDRTRSVLNLTSSTLFGIYSPADYDANRTQPPTPSANGSLTPSFRRSFDADRRILSLSAVETKELKPRHIRSENTLQRTASYFTLLSWRVILLFAFGVAYGIIISHLHDTQHVAPVQVQGLERSWTYLVGWGGVSVALGALLPYIDFLWEDVVKIPKLNDRPLGDIGKHDSRLKDMQREGSPAQESSSRPPHSSIGADWNPVVRSIGAFIGIAFAIRRLPWQSTLQVSLTLALVNPVLWYLVDRSKPGFLLSLLVGLAGTAIAFGVNPDIVPTPASLPSPRASLGASHSSTEGCNHGMFSMSDGLISNETIGVGTWIASVLFCSSVCFGNIGRRLALGSSLTSRGHSSD